MKKLNFKQIGNRAMGAAVGTIAGNFLAATVSKFTASIADPKIRGLANGLTLVIAGAIVPDMLGQKGPIADTAASVVIGKGVETGLKGFFPNLISGPEDDMVNGDEDTVAGIADGMGEQVVEGAEDTVAGSEDYVSATA